MRHVFLAALISTGALAAPCQELPILFIVQDKSGSMAGVPDPYGDPSAPSKWSSASAAVPSLVTQFQDRFRFGLMMFPGASTTFNCSTGVLKTSVPSTPSQVQSAYNNAAAGGGTPTAVSLDAARAYLDSISTSAPKFVLLITDGLPNCNLANDPATCDTTTPGCLNTSLCSGSSCCGLGAKDCLDDYDTEGAAAALAADGITVFVVGFGADVAGANNQAVLDAIASAGGSGQSYIVQDQASLASTLNSIAASTATCCQNACNAGAAMCTSSGQAQVCQVDSVSGCTTWTLSSCPSMSACVNGSCQGCSNACTLGASRCDSNGNGQTCQMTSSGCTDWTTTQVCNYGELCSGGQCSSCTACSAGATMCTANGVQECQWDFLSGCTQWVGSTCQAGSLCQNGACQACNGTCTAGAKQCSGNTVETCVADANGCTAWVAGQTCGNFCSGGACGVCGTSCTPGATQCDGNGVETCVMDNNGCTAWSQAAPCSSGAFCEGGACGTCATQCTPGAKQCNGSGVQECRPQGNGCNDWVLSGNCQAGDVCMNGACVPPCQDACTLGAGQCVGGAPSTCVKAPTGCTAWKSDPACASGNSCVDGVCRLDCSAGEVDSCPQGYECTAMPDARVCLPKTTSGGPADGGSGPGTVPVPKHGQKISMVGGCGCTATEGAPLLVWLALLRRGRRRTGSRGS
jgi:hypothetical protein